MEQNESERFIYGRIIFASYNILIFEDFGRNLYEKLKVLYLGYSCFHYEDVNEPCFRLSLFHDEFHFELSQDFLLNAYINCNLISFSFN